MFGNIAFIGIPVLAELSPQTEMLYIALFTVVDQLLLLTLGLKLTSANNEKDNIRDKLIRMINPATGAIALSITDFLQNIKMPVLLNTALTKMGDITFPLIMIHLG